MQLPASKKLSAVRGYEKVKRGAGGGKRRTAGTIEAVSEEVAEDLSPQVVGRPKLVVDVRADGRLGREPVNLRQRVADGEQDAVYLGIFVYEE